MAVDTYAEVWSRLLLRCPSLSSKLAQDFVRNAFRRLAERRRWSWKVKLGQFISPALYSTGTVTVTQNSTTVTGSGTTFTAGMVGRQFRTGGSSPIYTISAFGSATSITLDLPWGNPTATLQTYQIYQCFFTPPTDFHQFISVWDPSFNWQLQLNVSQSDINLWDAQRSNLGNSYCVSFRDFSSIGATGLPRYELWPSQQADHLYPFLYESVPSDLSETGITLPRYVRGDILLEISLEDVASWPGPSNDKPNPYFNPIIARKHRDRAEQMTNELEVKDDEIWMQDLTYAYPSMGWPYASPFGDSAWLQKHAI